MFTHILKFTRVDWRTLDLTLIRKLSQQLSFWKLSNVSLALSFVLYIAQNIEWRILFFLFKNWFIFLCSAYTQAFYDLPQCWIQYRICFIFLLWTYKFFSVLYVVVYLRNLNHYHREKEILQTTPIKLLMWGITEYNIQKLW